MKLRKVLYLSLAGLMIAGVGASSANLINPIQANAKQIHRQVKRTHQVRRHTKKVRPKTIKKPVAKAKQNLNPALRMREPISYRKSSEMIPYPKRLSARKDRIIVSTKKQRAYLMKGKKLLYEFYISTGKNVKGRRTPKGHYRIDGTRVPWFYVSTGEHEGARYAVGFIGGVYLFHETPSHRNGKIIKSVARDLGKKGSSYGCIHLSTRDAKWFYYHIPTGMRVIVR